MEVPGWVGVQWGCGGSVGLWVCPVGLWVCPVGCTQLGRGFGRGSGRGSVGCTRLGIPGWVFW